MARSRARASGDSPCFLSEVKCFTEVMRGRFLVDLSKKPFKLPFRDVGCREMQHMSGVSHVQMMQRNTSLSQHRCKTTLFQAARDLSGTLYFILLTALIEFPSPGFRCGVNISECSRGVSVLETRDGFHFN